MIPPYEYGRTKGTRSRSEIVQQNRPQERLPPYSDKRRGRMENRIPLLIWALRIHCHALRPSQCTCDIPRHDQLIFRDMLDQGMSAFMDDLIMWSDTRLGHDDITREVLRCLRDNRLCITPNKCEWAQHQIEFLGYMVSGEGVEMTDK